MKELQFMSQSEYQIFKSLYKSFENMSPFAKAIIYLRSNLQTFHQRIFLRKRQSVILKACCLRIKFKMSPVYILSYLYCRLTFSIDLEKRMRKVHAFNLNNSLCKKYYYLHYKSIASIDYLTRQEGKMKKGCTDQRYVRHLILKNRTKS